MFVSFGLLMIASLSLPPQDDPADEPGPLAGSRFRIASFEAGGTTSVRAIEAVLVAPVDLAVVIETKGPAGSAMRGRTSVDGGPGAVLGEVRLLALLSTELDGRRGTFTFRHRSAHGGGVGSNSMILPPDSPPLDELLIPLLEPGDYPIGDAVDAFRLDETTYTIRVARPEDLEPIEPAGSPRRAPAANP